MSMRAPNTTQRHENCQKWIMWPTKSIFLQAMSIFFCWFFGLSKIGECVFNYTNTVHTNTCTRWVCVCHASQYSVTSIVPWNECKTTCSAVAWANQLYFNIHIHTHSVCSFGASAKTQTHVLIHDDVVDCAPLYARIVDFTHKHARTHWLLAFVLFTENVWIIIHINFFTFWFFSLFIMNSIQWLESKREGQKKFGHPPKQYTIFISHINSNRAKYK